MANNKKNKSLLIYLFFSGMFGLFLAIPVSATIVVDDYYPESHWDMKRDQHCMYAADVPMSGQSFESSGGILDSVKFYLSKKGSPSGNMNVTIYNEIHTQKYGIDSVPAGSVLATSNSIAIDNSLPLHTSGKPAMYTFTFSGNSSITLTKGTKYILVLNITGGDVNNCLYQESDVTQYNPAYFWTTSSIVNDSTHPGNSVWWNAGSKKWSYFTSCDLLLPSNDGLAQADKKECHHKDRIFYVYVDKTISLPAYKPTSGPLKVNAVNPRYFQDTKNSLVYLRGSHNWGIIQAAGVASEVDGVSNTVIARNNYIKFMQEYNHNFSRLWTNSSKFKGENLFAPMPWAGSAPYDLTVFNEAYFASMAATVEALRDAGIYVSVMLFGTGSTMRNEPAIWQASAWNPLNNSNSAMDALSATDGLSFYTTNAGVLSMQKLLAKKTIDTLHKYDNVIWEIHNEGKIGPAGVTKYDAWQEEMVNYARSYEASIGGFQHLIYRSSGAIADDSDVLLFQSDTDIITPSGIAPYDAGGTGAYVSKPLILDTDHYWAGWSDPAKGDIYKKLMWKIFARGHNPIFMDSYVDMYWQSATSYNNGLMPEYLTTRKAMGDTGSYATKMNLKTAVPHNELSSTLYCLANPGIEYLVYQPVTGSFTVNLQAGTYNYEWFNPNTSLVIDTGSLTVSAGNRSFAPPFSGDAVLYLKSSSALNPICGANGCEQGETCSSCPSDCGSCNVIPPISGWMACAIENQQCSFSGTKEVQFGAYGQYYSGIYINGVLCANNIFGDPLVNYEKYCYYRDTTQTAPAAPAGVRVI